MVTKNNKKGLNISAKSFIAAIAIIFALMCLSYGLTFAIPGGEYARVTTSDGSTVLDTEGGFSYVDGGISFGKWICSPVLSLTGDGGGTIAAIIAFLLVIGGIFNSLEKSGLIKYMLDRIVSKFGKARYRLMAVIILFFMSLGSFIGSFEECVPLVPIVVALCVTLGWDELTGLGISLLAAGCGFAAGVCNPFTVGVAQELSGLSTFSGIWLRMTSFILIYLILYFFIRHHAKKIEKPLDISKLNNDFVPDKKMDKGLVSFAVILGTGIVCILSSVFITILQDLTMIIVAIMFLVAGIVSVILSGMNGKKICSTFLHGLVSILPAVLMILMASSIKYTLDEANILDTILHYAVGIAETMPKELVVIFIYIIVLFMNFFISSGSAKAFLLMPLIVPLAQIFDISSQLCVMAFAFGDGFSNVLYPTNPVLLISLGLSGVSYFKWFKWSWKFQSIIFILTSALLMFGLFIGYN